MSGLPPLDDIATYIADVFGNLDYDTEAAAERMQKRLGVEILPEDVDFIHISSVLQMMDMEYSELHRMSPAFSMKTQYYRDGAKKMRVEMEQQLRVSVAQLEADGLAHDAAIREALTGPVTLKEQRIRIARAADEYFRERVLEPAVPKKAMWRDAAAFGLFFTACCALFLVFALLHMRAGSLIDLFSLLPFLGGAGLAFFAPSRVVKPFVIDGIARVISRKPLPYATSKQKLRFFSYKIFRRPDSWFSLIFISMLASAVILSSLYCLPGISEIRYLAPNYTFFAVVLGFFLGKTFWSRLERSRHSTA